jgi:uncharacterized damage-inducible protein DinB
MKRAELLESLSNSRYAVLEHFDLPPQDRTKTYAPGKWTVRQILAHLADMELVWLYRVSRGLAEPGHAVEEIDGDLWAIGLDYANRPILINKELFHSARSQILYYIEALPESHVQQQVRYPKEGLMTVWEMLERLAAHTDHHLAQIDTARSTGLASALGSR